MTAPVTMQKNANMSINGIGSGCLYLIFGWLLVIRKNDRTASVEALR